MSVAEQWSKALMSSANDALVETKPSKDTQTTLLGNKDASKAIDQTVQTAQEVGRAATNFAKNLKSIAQTLEEKDRAAQSKMNH